MSNGTGTSRASPEYLDTAFPRENAARKGRRSRWARLIRKLAGYVLAAALGAAGALFYDAAHDIAALHGRVETAWSDVVHRYGERGHAVPAFVIAAKAAGGVDTGKLEEALATLVKIPIPGTPGDLDAFRHWEQAEINVSVTLADLFRSIPGTGGRRQSGDYTMALSRLEGTESGVAEAAGRYNRAIAAYEDATAKGLPAWISAGLYPGSAQWEAFTAFPDYGPLDAKQHDDD